MCYSLKYQIVMALLSETLNIDRFYLYQYKKFPYPDDKQLSIAPRDRFISDEQREDEPAQITK